MAFFFKPTSIVLIAIVRFRKYPKIFLGIFLHTFTGEFCSRNNFLRAADPKHLIFFQLVFCQTKQNMEKMIMPFYKCLFESFFLPFTVTVFQTLEIPFFRLFFFGYCILYLPSPIWLIALIKDHLRLSLFDNLDKYFSYNLFVKLSYYLLGHIFYNTPSLLSYCLLCQIFH